MEYNTGNPVGSTDPRDLKDNSEALDMALNSSDPTFVDRLGQTRPTLAGLETLATGVPAVGASIAAQEAQAAAEAARDAAQTNATLYPDEATGRAAVADNAYFRVVGSGAAACHIYKRINSGSSTLIVSLASDGAVLKPAKTGLTNGWPDVFFRHVAAPGVDFLGRSRWYDGGYGAAGKSTLSLVASTAFNGRALRKTGAGSLYGVKVYPDEMGAGVGDVVTLYSICKAGALGGLGGVYVRPFSAIGNALAAASVMLTDTGGAGAALSSTPVRMRASVTIPASTAFLWVYPAAGAANQDMDIVALWGHKGAEAAGLSWPVFGDDDYLRQAMAIAQTDIDAVEFKAEGNRGKVDYAVDSQTAVTASSTSVAITGTGFSATPRNLVFSGWAEKLTPAGVSFNAIRVKSISRDPAATAQWRTLNAIVRTGASPSAAGATVVAVGQSIVIPTADGLADVVIVLKDPITGDVKTLTDADFAGGAYMVGVYALTATGAPAACGEPRGTLSNSAGQSYYLYAGVSASSGEWYAYSSNLRIGFEHLLMVSPVEGMAYSPTAALLAAIDPDSSVQAPELVLPPKFYAVEGREMNAYFDNLMPCSASDYLIDAGTSTSVGQQQNERFTWTPAAAQASGTITISASDKRTGSSLVSKTATLVAAAASAHSGETIKVLPIGDSMTNAGVITQRLLDIAATDVMAITLLGTRGSGANKHEGRGGWSIATYTTNYSDGTYGANPFWIGGEVNFPQYLIDNGLATPDVVTIQLGTNDVFLAADDVTAAATADSAFISLDVLIASIKAAGPSVKVALVISPPPSSDQDAFGASYGVGATRWRFKRSILIWARQLIAKYAGQEANRIYIVPGNAALDAVNNMQRAAAAPVNSCNSSVTVARQNNGVHPDNSGYRQIGDAVWAFLKNL